MPIAVELDPALIGMGWTLDDIGPLDELDFHAEQPHGHTLDINAIVADADERRVVWTASLDVIGEVKPHSSDLVVQRGYGVASSLSELLMDRPLTIFFGNGDTVHGSMIVNSRARSHSLPALDYNSIDWSDADLTSETPKTAKDKGIGLSVQEKLENYLRNKPRRGRHRWIVHNDGGGEFADYIVIEVDRDSVSVGLWHAKNW